MRILQKSILAVTIIVIALGVLLPFASAGVPTIVGNFYLYCNGDDVVITWEVLQEGASGGNVFITWNDTTQGVPSDDMIFAIPGPGTFDLEILYWGSSGWNTIYDTITCPYVEPIPEPELGTPPVPENPKGHCFEDGRVNHNCGATISVYLTEIEDGWNILLVGLAEDLGQQHVFLSWEMLQTLGLGEVMSIGIVRLVHLPNDTFVLVAPRENGKPYYLHFKLAGPTDAYISDGDLGS